MAKVAFKKGLLANLPAAISEGTFYVTTDERALYLDLDDTTRIRVGDFDTGATSVEVVGDGNAVTAASYDPTTRKLILTADTIYATADNVNKQIVAMISELRSELEALRRDAICISQTEDTESET